MNRSKIIATDFDGTLCESKWPEIGAPNWEVIDYLKEQKAKGAKLILFTCREKELLANAVNWCAARGLFFDAFNENLPEDIELYGGRDCRKIAADEYLDDKSCTKFELPYIDLCKCFEPISNADRIRNMSDEELARWLVGATVCERVCDEDEYCHGNECVKRVTRWLKQPAKEEHNETDRC